MFMMLVNVTAMRYQVSEKRQSTDNIPLREFPMKIKKLTPMNNIQVLSVTYNSLHRPTHSLT